MYWDMLHNWIYLSHKDCGHLKSLFYSLAQTNCTQLAFTSKQVQARLKAFCKQTLSLKPYSYAQGQSCRCPTKVTKEKHANSLLAKSVNKRPMSQSLSYWTPLLHSLTMVSLL